MARMFCFDCGIKFIGTSKDLYETGDGSMVVPFCKKCSLNLNKESLDES